MLERWRRCWLLLLLGALIGMMMRQAPLSPSFIVGLVGYATLTEGLAAWLSERRSARLSYYRSWGLTPLQVGLTLSLAALPPVIFMLGLALGIAARQEHLVIQIALSLMTASLALALAAISWPVAERRPWLATTLPLIFAFVAAWAARVIIH